jgi:hypothetical protein
LDASTPDSGSADSGLSQDAGPPLPCTEFAGPEATGNVLPPELTEISGLAFSRIAGGRIYVHNDSGDRARYFALDLTGAPLAEVRLSGATARDWEDIAIGPGPEAGVSYLYLGDIGDNAARTGSGTPRSSIVVYRAPEPELPTGGPPPILDEAAWEAFELAYEDGAHDAEALFIEPGSGDLFLLTKEEASESGLFVARAPLSSAAPNTLTRLSTLSFGALVTAADISADGRRILARNYSRAFLWVRGPGQSVEEALAVDPTRVPLMAEPQGESIAFAADGSGYMTVSEGSAQPLYLYSEACE